MRGTHLLDRPCGEPNDHKAAVPRDALETRHNHADRVVHNVSAMAVGVLHDELLPPFLAVVDREVGAVLLGDVELGLRAGRGDHTCAEGLCNLDGSEANCG